jgi:hypothetical protein
VTRSIPEELYSGRGIVVIMRSPCIAPHRTLHLSRSDPTVLFP